jgi:hypothetical protein
MKWRMKLLGKAHVYRFVEMEAADLETAVLQAEKTYAEELDNWIVDDLFSNPVDRVHVALGSWKRIDSEKEG